MNTLNFDTVKRFVEWHPDFQDVVFHIDSQVLTFVDTRGRWAIIQSDRRPGWLLVQLGTDRVVYCYALETIFAVLSSHNEEFLERLLG
jgi:hypothetical protein